MVDAGAIRNVGAEHRLQFSDVFDQINAYASGSPINVVNPAVLAPQQNRA